VRLLLDTHILLWLMQDDPRLSQRAREIIDNSAEVYISVASIWEIAIKWRLGKIDENPQAVDTALEKAGLMELPISNLHAVSTAKLPLLHRDPFDRLLVAQAIAENLHFVTADPKLAAYSRLVVIV
jgi:PIN domain nuclease of toxin-antitoxin system